MRGLQTSYRKSDVELDEHDGHFKDQIASFHYFKETVTLMISSAAKNFLNSVPWKTIRLGIVIVKLVYHSTLQGFAEQQLFVLAAVILVEQLCYENWCFAPSLDIADDSLFNFW